MADILQYIVRRRSELLLCAFIALVMASPVADTHPHIGALIAVLILILLLVGVSYMADRRIVRMMVYPLAMLWVAARILEGFWHANREYMHLAPVAGLALSIAILWSILYRFGNMPRVTSSMIAEAFLCYLVLAIAFSQLYSILSVIIENPFNQVIPAGQGSTLLYFSIITLTSVGYGNIVPLNPYVRLVAAFESMTGIFFIAVIVARLVAAYRPGVMRAEAKSKEPDHPAAA